MHDLIRKLTWLIVIPGVLLLVGGAYVCMRGTVQGVQFSPDLVSHRSFHYYELFGVQVWPTRTREWRSALEEFLHAEGLVPPSSGEPRWHRVTSRRANGTDWNGPALAACSELGCLDAESERWVQWSTTHPELAAKVWPRVIALAREEQYDKISNAMLAAKLAEKDGNFEKYYREFADDDRRS